MESNEKENQARYHRYVDDLYTKEDVQELLSGLKSSESGEWLDSFGQDVWEESKFLSSVTDEDLNRYRGEARMLLKRLRRSRRNTRVFQILKRAASIAALICVVAGSMALWGRWSDSRVKYMEVSTASSERRTLVLPDGTHLTLNACSKVRYPERFVRGERMVELEGEGYFSVYRDEKHPFIVKTGYMSVKVLGTQFNVKAYSSDQIASVDVESGKVQVDCPEAMLRLKADEQMIVNKKSGECEKRAERHAVAVWRKGFLYFNRTPIYDVAKELERMYGCRISFVRGQEFENLISGEHDNMSLESVLQSMKYTSGIHYKKQGNQILLYKE